MALRFLLCQKCDWTITEPTHAPIPACSRCGAQIWRVLLEAEVDALFASRHPWRLTPFDLVLLRQLRIAVDVPEVS